MHVLIIEPGLTGHHAGYLERIASAYMQAGHTVTVTVILSNLAHPVFDRLKTKFDDAFHLALLDENKYNGACQSRFGLLGRELAIRRLFGKAFREIYRRKPVDYVFLPYLDYCLYALGLLGSPFGAVQWGGICMRPSFHYQQFDVIAPKPKLAPIKRALFLRLLRSRTLRSIWTIDELLSRYIEERHAKWSRRLQYLPDPAELKGNHTRESAREELDISEDALVVLVYGAIDERKGLAVLVEAACSPDVPAKLHLLVVGKQSTSMRHLINSSEVRALAAAGRLYSINEFVDDATQQKAFAATDIVWLGYKNHYTMSGVLVLAVMSNKPVIATEDGLIGWHTRNNNLGAVVDIDNVVSVREALIQFCDRTTSSGSWTTHSFANSTWVHFEQVLLASMEASQA